MSTSLPVIEAQINVEEEMARGTTLGKEAGVPIEDGAGKEDEVSTDLPAVEAMASLKALDSTKDLPTNPKENEGYQIGPNYWVWVSGEWVTRNGIYGHPGFEAYDAEIGNESTQVKTIDALYPEHGSPKRIVISGFDTTTNKAREDSDIIGPLVILMQNGVPSEVGQNGVTVEDLLKAVKIAVEGYQTGQFKCVENEKLLEHVNAALAQSAARLLRRTEEGTEGTLVGN